MPTHLIKVRAVNNFKRMTEPNVNCWMCWTFHMMFIASDASIASNKLSTITQKDDQEKYSAKQKSLEAEMQKQTPLQQTAPDMQPYDSPQTKTQHWRRPYDMDNDESMKFQISGYKWKWQWQLQCRWQLQWHGQWQINEVSNLWV